MVAHLNKCFENEKTQEGYYFDRDVKFALYDVNADGIDELFIAYNTTGNNCVDIYIYQNDKYILSEQIADGNVFVCMDEQFIFAQQYGGAVLTRIFNITDGKLIQTNKLMSSNQKFEQNGIAINESEYNTLLSSYKSKNLISINENLIAFSKIIDMSAYIIESQPTTAEDPYAVIKQKILNSVDNANYRGKDSHIENAPADMILYDIDGTLQEITVNAPVLYAGPNNSYSEVYRTAASERFSIVGENNEWYYLMFYSGSGAFSHITYGYMIKSSIENNIGKYNVYDTSAAGNDFSFSLSKTECKVNVSSGDLNLRAAPSMNGEVIILMPKDAIIYEYGHNDTWSYVSYSTGGTIYYGYASKQYIINS